MEYRDSLYDIVWQMLLTGCAYWAYSTDHGCSTPGAHDEPYDRCAGCWMTVRLAEEDETYHGEYRIDADTLLAGVASVASQDADHYPFDGVPIARAWLASYRLGHETTSASVDNPGEEVTPDEGDDDWADWVTQRGLFGEVVFG